MAFPPAFLDELTARNPIEDVVGQSHITETLQKAIDTDKVAHAYLFSGPRGTGKTSTAKIFARAMNCVHGPTSHPCNECEVCRHIMNGESLDVVEIDAASNRSIEDIRTLRETIKFMPAEGHKKIYIIDEVHMLTTEAFNALLKTLEEPPAHHVIFILATTEPERIPMTILSRCQRYEFRRITSEDIAKRLLYVASQEGIDLTKGAAHILAVQADGGMRDALSMLDQCVSNASGTIDEKLVRDLLGLIGKDWLFSLSQALFEGQGDVIIKDVDDVIQMGKEPRVILTELLTHLRAIMLCQADSASDTLAAYDDCLDELKKQAKELTPERVFQILGILQQALLPAKTSPVPRIAVEMGLLMAARQANALAQPVDTGISSQPARAAAKPRKPAPEAVPLPEDDYSAAAFPDEAVPFPEEEYSTVPAAPDVKPMPQVRPAVERPQLPVQQRPAAEPVTAAAEKPMPQPAAPAAKTAAAAPVEKAEYQALWKKMCAILDKEKKKAVLSCIRNGRVVYIGEGQVIVAFKTAFMVKRANREDYYKFTDAALSQILGGTYHMQGFLEGDAELDGYEKKKSNLTRPAEPEPLPEEDIPVPAPSQEAASSSDETAWQPASIEDMDEAERAALGPLLKNVGDCNIYIENKK